MKQTLEDINSYIPHSPTSTRKARNTITGQFISICQIIASRLCLSYLKLNGGYSLQSSISIDPAARYIFVANHQSQLDPFSVFAVLSFQQNLDAAPVRFLTAKTVYHSPLKPFLKSMGCYPTRGSRERIIDESVGYIRNGYNVFIFPEGKRTTEEDSEPRRGVGDLIQAATSAVDTKMILVHLQWRHKSFGRRHVTVSITPAPEHLYDKDAVTIMNALYKV